MVLVDSIWKIKGSYRLKKAHRGRWKIILIGCLVFIALGVSMLLYSFLSVTRMILFSGIILTADGDDFMENVEPNLKSILCRMKDAGDFDKVTILKPYSFVLVDEDKETVAELLLIDDDTLLVDDELLKGLDKELDEFLKNLLEK